MLLLRHVLGLAAADRFRHDRRPVHRAYDSRIFAHPIPHDLRVARAEGVTACVGRLRQAICRIAAPWI